MAELSLFEKMKNKLSNTKESFVEKIDRAFYTNDFDEDFYEELEESLILSDMGLETSRIITEKVKVKILERMAKTKKEVIILLKEVMMEMVSVEPKTLKSPTIILVVGVNGVGKTTTIAKLAHKYVGLNKKIVLAAGDTFRAAATEQLETWASRVGVDIIKSTQGADPSAVIFDAINAARARKADILICDTAGRLHNKVNLMNELEKITRTIDKEAWDFNQHHLLVLDATTGQNAVNQAQTFNKAVNLSGIVMTKMDGTSKGGVVISIINELKVPIEYIGIGENAIDLIDFDAEIFVELLYEEK